MKLRNALIAAAVSASTFAATVPVRADEHDHRYDDRPRYEDRTPRYEDRTPRYEDRTPRYEERGPRVEDRGPRAPRSGDLELLGTVTAGREMQRDLIEVRGHNRYSAIMFRVARGDADVEDIKVTFDNDQTHSPDTKYHFHEGDRSQRLDLPGDSRDIKRVRFLFRSAHGGRVAIEVFGVIR